MRSRSPRALPACLPGHNRRPGSVFPEPPSGGVMSNSKRNPLYPTLITWTDPTGHVHIPPDPPLREGYPPWSNRPHEYPRPVPLKKCPSTLCRRSQRCADLMHNKYCRKTNMDADEFRRGLLQRIKAILRAHGRVLPTRIDHNAPVNMRPLKQALQRRCDESWQEEVLKFQTDWIEAQKRSFAARATAPAVRTRSAGSSRRRPPS
jgi:hypothetical protein